MDALLDDIAIARWGAPDLDPVVLVHGSVLPGAMTWAEQQPLAERWHLRVLDRRGYGASPGRLAEDHEQDGADVASALGDGAHLVGFSYGGFAALLAAARRPEAVRSLTIIESPVLSLGIDDPGVAAVADRLDALVADPGLDDRTLLERFLDLVGSEVALPDPLVPPLDSTAPLLRSVGGLRHVPVPVLPVRAATFPKAVVSGGHLAPFETLCDRLAAAIGATRHVVTGLGHSIPRTGAPINEVLERTWRRAGRASPADDLAMRG